MPYYRYSCRRPLFHDEYLPALNRPNVTVVDCPGGIDRVTERGVVVDGHEYELDCIVYATGFEPEVTPLPRRLGHEVIGRDGRTIATKWEDGEATLFGLMTAGFPNLFLMPCPGHQAVVTVELHAAHRGRRRAHRRDRRRTRSARRPRLRRDRGSRGGLGWTDPLRQRRRGRRRASGRRAVYPGVTNALRRRGQHGDPRAPRGQLRRRLRRLLRLPRSARAMARNRRLRRPEART